MSKNLNIPTEIKSFVQYLRKSIQSTYDLFYFVWFQKENANHANTI